MRKVIWILSFISAVVISSTAFAADGFFVIPVGTRSINYDDVVSLKEYILPDEIDILEGGVGNCTGVDYTVPADKMLVITTVHLRPKPKIAGTYRYTVYLRSETPPQPGPSCQVWTFNLSDDGGGETRAYQFSPGIIIPGGDLVTAQNYVGSSDAISVELSGYLINK